MQAWLIDALRIAFSVFVALWSLELIVLCGVGWFGRSKRKRSDASASTTARA